MGVDRKKNLLKETKDFISSLGLTFDNVKWIGSLEGFYYDRDTWETKLDFDYDVGYGMGVDPNMVVVGDGWWLERDYEFADHWVYKSLPKKPDMEIKEYEAKYYSCCSEEEEEIMCRS